jgi:DNA modification methylase
MLELLHGHNVTHLHRLGAKGRRFVLAYLDPPFLSGKVYRMPDGEIAFDDRWPSVEAWLERLQATSAAVLDVLQPEGSIVVHVDPKVSHHVRFMLDDLFGSKCFASEIVWRYRRWPSKTPNFQRVHDVLLRYVRDKKAKPRFCQLYEPLASSTLATWGTRKQRAVVDETGRRLRSSKTNKETLGVPLGDVWDISIIAPNSGERTGYPTQKPRELLDRIVSALSNPGDSVLDPYCGSGTVLATCKHLGRHAVGIDASLVAIRVARERLKD